MTETAEPTRRPPLVAADLYDRVPCGLLTVAEDGQVLQVNATLASWLGMTGDELVEASIAELLEPAAQVFYHTRLLPAVLDHGEVREIAMSFRTTNEATLPVLVNARADSIDGAALVHLAVFDASQRQEFERQLLAARRSAEESQARTVALQNATTTFGDSESVEELAQALANSVQVALAAEGVAVFLKGHQTKHAGRTIPFDAALPPDGIPEEATQGTDVRMWSRGNSNSSPEVLTALTAAQIETMLVMPLLGRDAVVGHLGCYFAREPNLDEHTTELLRSLCRQAAQTISRLQLQTQLAAIALYDPLTGLANRALLRDHITRSVAAAQATHEPLALIFVDLDDFKSVNDELDHTAGDSVLKLIATRLRSSVRNDDLVCRYGGDEFIVVCQNTDEDAAATIAERIRVAIRQPLHTDGWQRTVTASVGVTVHAASLSHVLSGPDLLRVADRAMYRSKGRGKDQVSIITLG